MDEAASRVETPKILIVDDEPLIRLSVRQQCLDLGYLPIEAGSGREALESFAGGVDLTLLDYRLPDTDGLALLKRLRELDPEALVILMTAYSSIENSVRAMKAGAYHYICKPFEPSELMVAVRSALEATQIRRSAKLIHAPSREHGFEGIVGESTSMRAVKALLKKIAESPASTVLITGESGTGKDLAAKAIHFSSSRARGPFMNITCSALPEPLLESELFGHEHGAFSDTQPQKRGLFEQASGGTVFLDELSEASAGIQAKLLRVLDEKSFKRVGGTDDIDIDVRIIAATHRNLEECVRENRFREDLYYRLRVMSVRMPPLRERPADILPLVGWFIDRFNREFRKDVQRVSPEAAQLLETSAWPGNVRELKNAVEGAMLLSESDTLGVEDFQPFSSSSVSEHFRLPQNGLIFEDLERDLVRQALERSGGNQTRAAALLGLNRDQIRYRVEKFGLAKPGKR